MTLLRRMPLRIRLTLAFAGASAVLLTGAGIYIFLEVKSGLDASLDASLRSSAAQYARLANLPDQTRLRRALAVEGDPVQLVQDGGRVIASSPSGSGRPLLDAARLHRALLQETYFERREAVRLIGRPASPGRAIVISTSMVQRERALEELGNVLLIGAPLILLLSSGAGYLVASSALRQVDRMRRRAADISAATLDARLPIPRTHDELARLGETLNAMLGRLEASAAHEREFLAIASHELRTPLAILKSEVDLALHDDADEAELRAALASIGEEADRLIRLSEDLLVIARGQDGTLPLDRKPVALDELAAKVTQRFALIAPGAVHCSIPEGLEVIADELRLEQALGNLIDNAVRHGASPIEVTARRHAGVVEIHVLDGGGGFRAGELEQAFQRVGGGRDGGFGLGLAIVTTIAAAHGGSVGAANIARGADVWFTIPADPARAVLA